VSLVDEGAVELVLHFFGGAGGSVGVNVVVDESVPVLSELRVCDAVWSLYTRMFLWVVVQF
jgi:hypothetical protein